MVHYKLAQALQIHISAIYNYANRFDLCVQTPIEDIVNNGIILVSCNSSFSDVDSYVRCISSLGFTIRDFICIEYGLYKIIINGYLM